MEPAPTVVAVADSPAVRETLSILLEHDCVLYFLGPDRLGQRLGDDADLALVALRRPGTVLDRLTRCWPTLPVVAVLSGAPRPMRLPGIVSVPLEPRAIRTAVRQGVRLDSRGALRRSVRLVARTLQAELAYSFSAVRTLAPQDAATVGRDAYALFTSIIGEQVCVIATAMEQLARFQARPRDLTSGPRFALALACALSRADAVAQGRGLLCQVATDAAAPTIPGPVALAPLIAEFIRWHLRRRSGSSVATVRHTRSGLALRYRPRPPTPALAGSWPLLLAALMLERWSWRVCTDRDGDDETVTICRN
jgi:hypothetical protein